MDLSTLPEVAYDTMFGDARRSFGTPRETRGVALLQSPDAAAVILDLIASGRLLSDIAVHLDVPQMDLRLWVSSTIPTQELDAAKRAGAESLMFKAAAVLEVSPGSAQDAAQMRALSAHYTKLAERMDADMWGPPKNTGGGQSVVLNLGFGGGSAPVTIEHNAAHPQEARDFDPSGLIAQVLALEPEDAEPADAAAPGPSTLEALVAGMDIEADISYA